MMLQCLEHEMDFPPALSSIKSLLYAFALLTSVLLKGIVSKSMAFLTALGPEFTVICHFLPLRVCYGRS